MSAGQGVELALPTPSGHTGTVRKTVSNSRRNLARGGQHPIVANALEAKYPGVGQRWGWFWLFPARALSIDPRSGVERRHHLYEERLQRALKKAVEAGTGASGFGHASAPFGGSGVGRRLHATRGPLRCTAVPVLCDRAAALRCRAARTATIAGAGGDGANSRVPGTTAKRSLKLGRRQIQGLHGGAARRCSRSVGTRPL